jgi:hypothetical protein
VAWRTYFRGVDPDPELDRIDLDMFREVMIAHSLVGRHVAERENPYLSRTQQVDPHPDRAITVLPSGVATVRLVDDGTQVLTDLGVLTGSEAARLADTLSASGAAQVAAVALGVS